MLSRRLPEVGGTFIQMEDEIASIAAVCGASLAGTKALTATSGPGFSLMQEMIGFATMAQIPCVVVDVMRGGPSTGLPTEPAQGDVMQARWGTHGEHSVIALVPSSVEECYTLTVEAFNLSEQYRTPVIILSDALIGHMREAVVLPEPGSLRIAERGMPDCEPDEYDTVASTLDNILPRPPLGSPFKVHVTGLVYNRRSGAPDTSDPAAAADLGRYLREKIYHHRDAIVRVEEVEMDGAEVAIFAYGSVARSALAVVRKARAQGVRVGMVRPITLWPFPTHAVERMAEQVRTVIVPGDEHQADELGGPGRGRRARQGRGLRACGRQAHHARRDLRARQTRVLLPPLGGRMSALVDEQRLEASPTGDPKLPRIKPHTTSEIKAHLRSAKTLWCPGCSNGTITRALIDAILGLELDPEKVVVVAGIGCSGRISAYLDYSTVHTAHGRALAVATGVKAADPSLHVIVAMGDGDSSAIGGNHFIHAARRNIDLTALVFNNSIYGMTGGQMSPTTHLGDKSTTSVYGNVEPAFDLCELAHAAGATYVARGTSWGYQQLANVIAGGIAHKGFAMVEAMAICPVYYGRFNLTADPAEFLESAEGARGAGRQVRRGRDAQPRPLPGRAAAPHASARSSSPRCGRVKERAQGGRRWLSRRRRPRRRGRRRVEIRCSGSGGQGILLAAAIIAEAAAALGRHVVQTQSYGPEARGGASKAEVIVSDEPIDYPEVRHPDVSLVLSQAAYEKYAADTRPGGLLIYDSGLVEIDPDDCPWSAAACRSPRSPPTSSARRSSPTSSPSARWRGSAGAAGRRRARRGR